MSIQFNDTTARKGLVQFYEKECGFDRDYIAGNTTRLKEFTADVNVAFDDFLNIGFSASGTWQLDDSNHTDYPIISTYLVSGQRDYTFTTDGSGNLILDIYKVLIKQPDGTKVEITPVDVQSEKDNTGFTNGLNLTGTPTIYEKTGNGIFLDPIPSYNMAGGLELYINREASYFAYTDTTKKPGVPGTLHKWFYLKPAYEYARLKNPELYNKLSIEIALLEKKIGEVFGGRERDVIKRLKANVESCK